MDVLGGKVFARYNPNQIDTVYAILFDLGFMLEKLSVIRSHHEKWNGQGYPDRLKEEQIPLLAVFCSSGFRRFNLQPVL